MKELLTNVYNIIKAVFIIAIISILAVSCGNEDDKRAEKIRQEGYEDGYRDGYYDGYSEAQGEYE